MKMQVIKRNGSKQTFSQAKVKKVLDAAFKQTGKSCPKKLYTAILNEIYDWRFKDSGEDLERQVQCRQSITVEEIQNIIEEQLMRNGYSDIARNFIIYRNEHKQLREWAKNKQEFIEKYKNSGNTADATIDDNANFGTKNIGVMNFEIHKEDNAKLNRYMVMDKLREMYPEFDAKQYSRDLESHIIYKHDESSFAGAIAPYCCSITMYPFLNDGIKQIGGLSASPKNLDSFCGMYVNLIFATSAQFAGAVATSEFLLYFDYFARKEFGDDYFLKTSKAAKITYRNGTKEEVSIEKQIDQYFQQVVYSINQPAAARGLQSAFVNFSYFDKMFFNGMFGTFYFPDGTQPIWESFNWLQRHFMQWFNKEREKCMLTFPVESFALIYQDGKFADQDSADFVAQEYANGHSFFTYISDSVDSLASCCRLRNQLTTNEFNFTNGNMGVSTGSKSVITLNLNRIMQDFAMTLDVEYPDGVISDDSLDKFCEYLKPILGRIYKYHSAYNAILHDMYDAGLLPVYKAGFITLDKQYLTIGINGLNEAAEFCGIRCSDNPKYSKFCQKIFGTIKEQNQLNKTKSMTFNTECVPAESLAVKNYNWDKADGYWVPEDRNLYASYIFKPSDTSVGIDEKIRMHGRNYIGDYLDGGSAAHLNLSEHLSYEQYKRILRYAAEQGCQYLTFNVPNSECLQCGHITKKPVTVCPKCGGNHIAYYDRIIGYLTRIDNWSEGRRIEQKTRYYASPDSV